MRILFFSHYFPPEVNAPASRTFENCRRWARDGHTVTVITCAPNCPNGILYKGYKNRFFQRETVDGIQVIRTWTYIAANRGSIRRTLNYITYMISATICSLFVIRPDIIIATSPQFFCGWAGLIASRLRRVRCVLEIRDIWPDSIVAVGAIRNRHVLRVLEWLERRMYSASHHIVTVGEGYRDCLIRKGVPVEKISVVMNGVDQGLFSHREPVMRLKHELGLEGKFVCSYIGTIGMACGLEVVLRAARLLKERGRNDIAFLLVGDGAIKAKLEKQASLAGLDNVVLTGRQDKERVPDFLSISDACLVHLKKTDLFTAVMPSKIFEAAAMGRPIINGVEGYASKMVKEAGAGLCVEPENEQQIVEALVRLADNPGFRRSLGEAGREYFTSRFDRGRLARDYIRLIERLRADSPLQKGASVA